MFDTMTMTKATGAVCGALLVLMLGGWAASALYDTTPHGGGHGEEVAQAYTIDTGAAAASDEPEEAVDYVALMAAADPAKGEKVFNKCKACHKLDGVDGTGPHLNGVVERPIASVGGFGYSTTMAEHAGTPWTVENLDHFLRAPKSFAANTKMSFAGLPKQDERINLIAYLATIQ
ncbi:cytochrome c family protein [Xinfangfangia sp. D13-10-4-6]|uniref:c-type cytochrome n=1 Tax=Pseudogemmobacter hezensis TaxID=2737662 RepID=UPI0015531D73|nr:cytochrome c family protein [Pseudogemmobacter hezensis]NPD14368.1 cytochrome c family protein [Pseudogemmobacter hezensis]